MTTNQIAYQRLVEDKRHNLSQEAIGQEQNRQGAVRNKTQIATTVLSALSGSGKLLSGIGAVGRLAGGGAATIR